MPRSMVELHRSLMTESKMVFPGSSPVSARRPVAPVVPQDTWHTTQELGDSWTTKRFVFNDNVDRNRFVTDVLSFEEALGRSAVLTLSDKSVHVRLPGAVGALNPDDKAYTVYADDAFRDLMLSKVLCP